MLRRINISKFPVIQHPPQVGDLLPDRTYRLIRELPRYFVRGNMVISFIECIRHLYLYLQIGQFRLNNACDFNHFEVLESEIKRSPVDLLRLGLYQYSIEVDHIGHAHIGPALLAAMDRNDSLANG